MKEGVCLKKAVTAFACPDGGHPYVQSGLDQIPVGSPFQEIQFPTFNLNKFISTKVKSAFISTFCAGDNPDQAEVTTFVVYFILS
jgi:hypothetical protein